MRVILFMDINIGNLSNADDCMIFNFILYVLLLKQTSFKGFVTVVEFILADARNSISV